MIAANIQVVVVVTDAGPDFNLRRMERYFAIIGRSRAKAGELMVLPRGGIIIDNPGIREVHMWTDEATLRERFADLEALAGQCRFDNCRHGPHAGCAIRSAMAEGKIEASRLEGFLKLEEEIAKLRLSRKTRQVTIDRPEQARLPREVAQIRRPPRSRPRPIAR